MSSFGDPQCPLCTASSWNVFFILFEKCVGNDWLMVLKKKNVSTFWAVGQLNRLSLSKTLCLILSPSCLRFYVFKSSFTQFYQISFYRTVCTSDGQKRATVTKLPVMLPHLPSPVVRSVDFFVPLPYNGPVWITLSFSQQMALHWRLQVRRCDCMCHLFFFSFSNKVNW